MRILIAEDERMSRHLLETTLCGWGYDVVSARDGIEAWQALRQEDAPQLAILDWVMPGMDGRELCRQAREAAATASIHIILLTARGDKNDMLAGLAAGANDYLVKPFDRAELQARVQAGARMVELRLAMMAELQERQRAEEVLRLSEQRFRSLIENSSDAIALFDTDGGIGYASPSTPQVLGYNPEEFVLLNALEIIHPDDRQAVKGCVKQALEQPRTGVGIQARVRHKNGTWRWVEGTFTNLLEEPSVAALVNNYRDITERHEAEEALRKSEKQLRLAQKLEAVGRLAGGVAHDFNNLLTVINGYGDLLLRDLTDSRLRPQAEEIRKAGERASSLTRQLLAFSRKQVLQPIVLDLNATVNNVGKMLQRLIGEDIELVLTLKPALGHVKADPGQIEQVLMNLVVNARDAMPLGGKLLLETDNVELTEEFAVRHMSITPGSYVRLTVTDNGQGMDAETQKHIFEPFFTTKEVGKGTGLGLATVYGIVKQSGGHIWVYSELDRGTAFKIYLPQVHDGTDPVSKTTTDTTIPGGSETILLVEDEDEVRQLAREVLEHAGYRVLAAGRAEQAIRLCEENHTPIDLLLTDVVMPQISGTELAKRTMVLRPTIRVLFMSGYTDDAIVHHGILDSGLHFIEKPFTPASLARKVRMVLDHKVLAV